MERMRAYYNEIDPFCCGWISNLMDAGHITPGVIDDRSIKEVRPDDLAGFHRVHLFAGIAGWDHALSLAGWGGRPVWTGSAPCQPFSSAGKGLGTDDPRHLWPDFYRLICECRPATVFGEQTSGAAGEVWLDGIFADMEAEGIAVGAADIPSASVAAPMRGQRLYWVAQADGKRVPNEGRQEVACSPGAMQAKERQREWVWADPRERGVATHGHDGKRRRLPPGIVVLADGIPGRVDQICAFGNAIDPHLAAEFIAAYLETLTPHGATP